MDKAEIQDFACGFFACWRYEVDRGGWPQEIGGVGVVGKHFLYPKPTGQIRSEWRESSWKPSWVDPFLRLSHIPPNPSVPFFLPVLSVPTFYLPSLPASTQRSLFQPPFSLSSAIIPHFSNNILTFWSFLRSFFSFCVASPLLFFFYGLFTIFLLLHLPSQQDLGKVGSTFNI